MSESGSGEPVSSSVASDIDSSDRVCRDCGKEYANRSGLKYHYRSDNNDCLGVECPKCGKSMVSQRGVKLHHKRVHGESIYGTVVECENCGREHRKRLHRAENNDVHYCDPKCQAEHYATDDCPIDKPSGKNAYNWNRVEYDCDNCGETMERQMSRLERSECLYCSPECQYEHMSERYNGSDHPLYKTGAYGYAGPKWLDIAENAREKYDYTCQGCGVSQSELEYTLHVHHVTPLRKFEDYEIANDMDNLVPLCKPCHGKWEGMNVKPELASG